MTTITTREGLDALPIGKTIRDSHGDLLTKTGPVEWRDEANEMDHDTDEIMGAYDPASGEGASWLPAEVIEPGRVKSIEVRCNAERDSGWEHADEDDDDAEYTVFLRVESGIPGDEEGYGLAEWATDAPTKAEGIAEARVLAEEYKRGIGQPPLPIHYESRQGIEEIA